MKWVEERQKRRPLGRASISFNMVDPVVVKPETLSNQAFIKVNSPPYNTYGSIPNMKDRSHDKTMVRKPSFNVSGCLPLTKINGNAPTRSVIMKLIS